MDKRLTKTILKVVAGLSILFLVIWFFSIKLQIVQIQSVFILLGGSALLAYWIYGKVSREDELNNETEKAEAKMIAYWKKKYGETIERNTDDVQLQEKFYKDYDAEHPFIGGVFEIRDGSRKFEKALIILNTKRNSIAKEKVGINYNELDDVFYDFEPIKVHKVPFNPKKKGGQNVYIGTVPPTDTTPKDENSLNPKS